MQTSGYLYLRQHPAYDSHNAYKLGIATNLTERDATYATSEIVRGSFIDAYKVDNPRKVEAMLHKRLFAHKVYYGGGTEFYSKKIRGMIAGVLTRCNIPFVKLTQDEIDNAARPTRDKSRAIDAESIDIDEIDAESIDIEQDNDYANTAESTSGDDATTTDVESGAESDTTSMKSVESVDFSSVADTKPALHCHPPPTPRPYQQEIIDSAIKYFDTCDRGILNLCCGMGKTYISQWIALGRNAKKILVAVPSLVLQDQWCHAAGRLMTSHNIITNICDIPTGDAANVPHVVIVTYCSAHALATYCNANYVQFDMAIFDEVHHLASSDVVDDTLDMQGATTNVLSATTNVLSATTNVLSATTKSRRTYTQIFKVRALKQLSLSATLDTKYFNIKHCPRLFGGIIAERGIDWAIDNNIICDYMFKFIDTDEDAIRKYEVLDEYDLSQLSAEGIEHDDIPAKTKRRNMQIGTIAALKCIVEKSAHHILIYVNNIENANKIYTYINWCIQLKWFDLPGLYHATFHSKDKKYQKESMAKFMAAPIGILTCVYSLGEGFDLPLLDGVVLAEPMKSPIRIVQSVLRASRKNVDEVDKVAKIIMPVVTHIVNGGTQANVVNGGNRANRTNGRDKPPTYRTLSPMVDVFNVLKKKDVNFHVRIGNSVRHARQSSSNNNSDSGSLRPSFYSSLNPQSKKLFDHLKVQTLTRKEMEKMNCNTCAQVLIEMNKSVNKSVNNPRRVTTTNVSSSTVKYDDNDDDDNEILLIKDKYDRLLEDNAVLRNTPHNSSRVAEHNPSRVAEGNDTPSTIAAAAPKPATKSINAMLDSIRQNLDQMTIESRVAEYHKLIDEICRNNRSLNESKKLTILRGLMHDCDLHGIPRAGPCHYFCKKFTHYNKDFIDHYIATFRPAEDNPATIRSVRMFARAWP